MTCQWMAMSPSILTLPLNMGMPEWIAIGIVALLIVGRRQPPNVSGGNVIRTRRSWTHQDSRPGE
jgi:hypothetical protein